MVDGRTMGGRTNDGRTLARWVYYKLTCEPNSSGELTSDSDKTFRIHCLIHVKIGITLDKSSDSGMALGIHCLVHVKWALHLTNLVILARC